MKRIATTRWLTVAALAATGLLSSTTAHAQGSSGPASQGVIEAGVALPPTVMLLLDTSGSMELLTSGTYGDFPVCDGDGGSVDGFNRAHVSKEILLGKVNTASRYCATDTRLVGDPLVQVGRIDTLYPLRPQGIPHLNECVSGATDPCLPTTVTANRTAAEGILDKFENLYFGFGAFDSFVEADGTATGMWSYGPEGTGTPGNTCVDLDYDGSGSEYGMLEYCVNLGIRNEDAPEGGLVYPFAEDPVTPGVRLWDDPLANRTALKASIEAFTPYWSTPIAAMLRDVRWMYSNDTVMLADPLQVCRPRYAILITDGDPTFEECVDPDCRGDFDDGRCPLGCAGYQYEDAVTEALRLYEDLGVQLYVIGFQIPESDLTNDNSLINRVAFAGSNNLQRAFSADNYADLLVILNIVLNQVSEGTISRTVPATTLDTYEWRRLNQVSQYRFESKVAFEGGSPHWGGQIVRRKYVCNSDLELEEEGSGDPLELGEDVLDDAAFQVSTRKVYTSSPAQHVCETGTSRTTPFENTFGVSGAAGDVSGLRNEDIEAACCAGALPGDCAITAPEASDPNYIACTNLKDGAVGFNVALPEAPGYPGATCTRELKSTMKANPELFAAQRILDTLGVSTVSDEDLSEGIIEWVRGQNLAEQCAGGSVAGCAAISAIVPSGWVDRRGRLGAIYHSSPQVLGGPDPRQPLEGYLAYLSQELSIDDAQAPGSKLTVATRPTMLYVGSNNGMLHAFDVESNKELWSFVPASILHRLGETLLEHKSLMDASPVIADLRTFRTTIASDEQWHTMLVTGYRGGGRGFMALDVTDPALPNWRWELDAELDPMLGMTYGEPALTSVFLEECRRNADNPCELGVAILPGGLPATGLANQAVDKTGRVVYVVDAYHGDVLRRFTQYVNREGDTVDFPAPITGSVAVDGTGLGSVSTRAFFGDGIGRLYRLDMSSRDEANWQVELFFDPSADLPGCTIPCERPLSECVADIPYCVLNPGDAPRCPVPTCCNELLGGGSLPSYCTDTRGPIFYRPAVAGISGDNRLAILFGYGRIDDLTSGSSNNIVVSVREKVQFTVTGGEARLAVGTSNPSEINWALQLQTGERLTTEPIIFDNVAYFATFQPSGAGPAACSNFFPRVYGIDFLGKAGVNASDRVSTIGVAEPADPDAPTDNVFKPGIWIYDEDDNRAKVRFIEPGDGYLHPLVTNGIVFGLSFVQTPDCVNYGNVDDAYGLGGGQSATGGASGGGGGSGGGGWQLQIAQSFTTQATPENPQIEMKAEISAIDIEQAPMRVFTTSWGVLSE